MDIHCSHDQTYQLWTYTVPMTRPTSYGHTLFPCPDLPAMDIHCSNAQTYQLWTYTVPMSRQYLVDIHTPPPLRGSHIRTWSPEQCGHAKNNNKLAASKAYSIPPRCADQNPVKLSKIIFSALNFFMHIYNMSVANLPHI